MAAGRKVRACWIVHDRWPLLARVEETGVTRRLLVGVHKPHIVPGLGDWYYVKSLTEVLLHVGTLSALGRQMVWTRTREALGFSPGFIDSRGIEWEIRT